MTPFCVGCRHRAWRNGDPFCLEEGMPLSSETYPYCGGKKYERKDDPLVADPVIEAEEAFRSPEAMEAQPEKEEAPPAREKELRCSQCEKKLAEVAKILLGSRAVQVKCPRCGELNEI